VADSPIRVFLLDDHEIVRRGLRHLLESTPDIVVVGEGGEATGAVEKIVSAAPDVAVLDGRLPDGSGIEVCREVRAGAPQIKALILTSYDDDEAVFAALMAGASGYVLKQIEGESLLSSIRMVASGHSLIDPKLALRFIERTREEKDAPVELASLTSQERTVLFHIAEGLTNREIGARMFLAEKTVKNHVTSMMATLGVQRRTQAALLANKITRP